MTEEHHPQTPSRPLERRWISHHPSGNVHTHIKYVHIKGIKLSLVFLVILRVRRREERLGFCIPSIGLVFNIYASMPFHSFLLINDRWTKLLKRQNLTCLVEGSWRGLVKFYFIIKKENRKRKKARKRGWEGKGTEGGREGGASGCALTGRSKLHATRHLNCHLFLSGNTAPPTTLCRHHAGVCKTLFATSVLAVGALAPWIVQSGLPRGY